jgi:hypothetical protein
MEHCARSGIVQECPGDVSSLLACRLAASRLARPVFRLVAALQLVVPGGLPKQILEVRRRVVDREGVDARHVLVGVELIPRPELQPRHALRIDADQVQPVRWHLHRDVLRLVPIAAVQQRSFPAFL